MRRVSACMSSVRRGTPAPSPGTVSGPQQGREWGGSGSGQPTLIFSLGWGLEDAAAGGLGAVSVFVSLARGAQGSTTMGWDAKGAARGSVALVLEL